MMGEWSRKRFPQSDHRDVERDGKDQADARPEREEKPKEAFDDRLDRRLEDTFRVPTQSRSPDAKRAG